MNGKEMQELLKANGFVRDTNTWEMTTVILSPGRWVTVRMFYYVHPTAHFNARVHEPLRRDQCDKEVAAKLLMLNDAQLQQLPENLKYPPEIVAVMRHCT